jgi:hypothetical protein
MPKAEIWKISQDLFLFQNFVSLNSEIKNALLAKRGHSFVFDTPYH